MSFMKKFITFAKQVKPTLTGEASQYIGERYADLREFDETKEDRERTSVVTARTLETLIRLSTAHAKIRLSKTVDRRDAEAAFSLLHYALFKEKPQERLDLEEEEDDRKRRRREGEDENEHYTHRTTKTRGGGHEEDGEETADADAPTAKRARKEREEEEESGPLDEPESLEIAVISVDRYQLFRRHLRSVMDEKRKSEAPLKDVLVGIDTKMGRDKFSQSEVSAAIERLADDNVAMVSEGTFMLI